MGTRFRALACPIDASTGDRRRFAEGALTHQPLPMPGRWVREDIGGHDGAVTVAALDGVEMDGSQVWITGHWFDDVDRERMPRLAEDVAEAMHLAREGVLGFSVDLDAFEAQPVEVGSDEPIDLDGLMDEEMDLELLVTQGRIRAATLVDIPAYVETNHTIEFLDGEGDAQTTEADLALVASVSGDTSLPVVDDREHEWDGPGAAGRVFDAYSDEDGNVDKERAARAFLWVDGDGTQRGDYKLGFADLVDGELKIIPRGVAATAGGRGVDSTDIPADAKGAVKSRICALYATVRDTFEDWPECPFDSEDAATDEDDYAALTASVATDVYPISAFSRPERVAGPTPMTYDFTANPPVAYGHIALWSTCHVGFSDSCVLAPRDPSGEYRDFHAHRVETDEGTAYVGRITVGGNHASTDEDVTAHGVRTHHDDMVTAAYVRLTEDEFGAFVCGPIVGDLDEETLRILSRRKVSGDWRETAGGLSLIEVLALKPGPRSTSEPGFPVVQFGFSGGRQVALVAALGPEVSDVSDFSQHVAAATREAVRIIREEDAARAAATELEDRLATDAQAELRAALA